MLVRETMYYLMSTKMLNKRVNRLGVKISKETDPSKKIKILGDISDIVKATIRKNRRDKKFLDDVANSLQELVDENEFEPEGSHH